MGCLAGRGVAAEEDIKVLVFTEWLGPFNVYATFALRARARQNEAWCRLAVPRVAVRQSVHSVWQDRSTHMHTAVHASEVPEFVSQRYSW